MCKRLLLLTIIYLGGFTLLHADNGSKSRKSMAKKAAVTKGLDTAGSQKQGLNELKELYIANAMASGNGSKLNPRAISFVQDYIAKNREDLEDIKARSKPYFKLIDGIFAQYGLPTELKYLAVIESQLKPGSVSGAGAVGPWQLMPGTARVLGLKVSHNNDERRNYAKSTRAAAIYLRDLYAELGDWLLVIAAYNGGAGNVFKAMKKSHSEDFWNLQYYLPTESRNHVKKFIGTHYYFEGQGGVTTLTRAEATKQLSGSDMYVFSRKLTNEEMNNSKTVFISGKYVAPVIARYTLMDFNLFSRYNPDFDKVMASSNNTYDLRLPADKIELFATNKYQILDESVKSMLSDETAELAIQKVMHDVAKKDEE
ncbi:MAG: lytic transglycosylase domain-containing protein [Chitinophagales bacterium]